MVANITIDFLLTMTTEVTNVPLFTIVTVTIAPWARLREGAKRSAAEYIPCTVLLLDCADRQLTSRQSASQHRSHNFATVRPMLRNTEGSPPVTCVVTTHTHPFVSGV